MTAKLVNFVNHTKQNREISQSRYLDGKLKNDAENYLLIDEVQDIDGFENVLRSLNADEECQDCKVSEFC